MKLKNNKINYSYGRQIIEQDDINAIIEVLKSDWLTQGPKVQEFERELGSKFGARYVSVVSNGTAALHLTGLALGWKKNDVIITSPITFLASANCILYSGATPDFADIDENYYTLDENKLEEKIKNYLKKKKKIKAVVAVDFAGQPCDWKGMRYLADKYEFQLVNDNCHAIGAKYYGSEKYAVKYSDVVCQSYHPVKHITTGEGGAILTNDKNIDEKVKILRTHGIVKDKLLDTGDWLLEKRIKDKNLFNKNLTPNNQFPIPNPQHLIPNWYYEMHYLGFNYRITDFQCALGISQLKKLDRFVERRREIAKYYDEKFGSDDRFIIPREKKNNKHSYHLYPLQINFDKLSLPLSFPNVSIGKPNIKIEIFNELIKNGINCQVHYIPIHLQPYYKKFFGFRKGDFPVAEKFYEGEISIPMYPSLTKNDLSYIVKTVKNVIQ